MKLFSLLFLCFTSVPLSYAEEVTLDKELKAYFVRFNLVRSKLRVEHKEESSNSAFEALDRTVKMDENSLDFIFGREFYRQWPISFSLHVLARGTVGSGGKQGAGDSENLNYQESLQGYGAGWGGSLNFNFTLFKTRTQFFFAGQGVKQKNKYFLRYFEDDSDEHSVEIQTDDEATNIQYGFGVRVYNLYNGYTFSIAVHKHEYTSDKIAHKASQGSDSEFELTKNPEFTRGNTAYSIGFGGTF